MGSRVICAVALAFAAAAPGWALADAPPVATAISLTQQGDEARITLALDRAVAATARPIADPERILVDLPEVDFRIDPATAGEAPRSDLVKSYRFGALAPGKARLVVELKTTACVSRLESRAADGKGSLTLALSPCDSKRFQALAGGAPLSSVFIAPEPPEAKPIIVLDPGHGGADGGANGAKGLFEKSIVFDFAQEAKRQLEASGKFQVVLTRADDSYVSLEDRVRIAREVGAALMISIHADTLPRGNNDVAGTTVYTCSERASDAVAQRIAEHENAVDRGEVGAKAGDPGIADILFDLKRRETRAYAHVFSRGLVTELRGVGRLNHNPERSARFMVLKAPDFPSVLIELGYLSNPQDTASMTSPEWRQRTATALVTAIERFFAPSPAKSSEAVAAAPTR